MRRRAKPIKKKPAAKRSPARKTAPKGSRRLRDLEKRLAEAIEQQTAASEILRVISSVQTDLEPVFSTIVKNAGRVCDAVDAVISLADGAERVIAAHWGPIGAPLGERSPLTRGTVSGRAILDARAIHVEDLSSASDFPQGRDRATRFGHRTTLAVPLLRESRAIGSLMIRRSEVRPFSDKQISMLLTFADQAVIAIENARLLTELQQKNAALAEAHAQVTEALEQQTATSEILRVMSRSQADVQPVFDTIVSSAVRLCGGLFSSLFQFDGELVHMVAHHNYTPEALEEARRVYPSRLSRGQGSTRAILDRAVVHIPDFEVDPDYQHHAMSRAIGWRGGLFVPMLREGAPIGVIMVARAEPGPFSDNEIELLKTFADQAVIAVENVRLFTELQASNRDLTTALDTQTATSDILRVISRSQRDVQPVFDAIVQSAVRLLGAHTGALTQIAGDQIELAALTSTDDAGGAALRAFYPRSLHSEGPHPQAIRDRAPLNITDAHTDPRLPEAVRANAPVRGYRSTVVVPMLRHDEAVGTLGVSRREPGGFTDDEIALLKTFADQAVIAIENVRLFTELQEKNRAVTEALEQQTATSEILRVIASSPTDVQPVFRAIVASAARLCGAPFTALYRYDGELVHVAAHHGLTPEVLAVLDRLYPMRPARDQASGRVILTGAIVHIPEVLADPEYRHEVAIAGGWGSLLAVPLMREGRAVGTINIYRAEAKPFPENQIELLKTFADQAVIAVENVRLFTELQTSNRELTAALDTQTATSDILRVISRSQTDVQPVFDAILASAVRLLRAYAGVLTRIEGDRIELAAHTSTDDAGDAAQRAFYPQTLHSETPTAWAIRERAPINIADAHTDPRISEAVRALSHARGARSRVVVPLLRHDEAVGTIAVSRHEPGGFTDDEIALLQTFADQAVIAIENARLLTELQARTHELTRSVDQLTALGDVGSAVSSSLDLDTVLTTIVGRAVQLSGTDGGTIFEYDEGTEEFSARATLNADADQSAIVRATRLRRGEGAVGQLAVTREPIQISDIAAAGAYESRLRGALLAAGTRAVLAIPLLHEQRLVGGLVVTRNMPGEFTVETVDLLRTFATQSALAIQNARLFHEIQVKSRELEVASQHKSEFLASMSHELRTPLNAIIGFSDVLLQGMFGETNEKQTEYLRDILASGQHLLSLINDILDLSKIEAGRMELDLAAFDLPAAIDDALLLMRERAGRRGIALERHVDERVGEIHADQRKVKQVLLNLLSNAVKFTPEGGRIDVRAALANGTAEISVIDTGIGIAPEDHDAVFEEFRQVGAAEKKAEGTGLGLALCRRFVELHGGRIWVKSQPGAGSTFTFSLPLRP